MFPPQRPTVHALDLDTGAIVWQNQLVDALGGDASYGPTSSVPGVVIVGSVITPHLRMFDADDGTLLVDRNIGFPGGLSGISSGAAVIDVLGGHTDLTFVVPGTVKQHLQAGTLVGLAITGNKPSVNAPDVPTFASVGLGAVNPGSFRFLAAPAGVPSAIQSKLTATLGTVMKAPELQAQLADNDFDPTAFLPHPNARGFVEKEIGKWVQAVKDSGAKP